MTVVSTLMPPWKKAVIKVGSALVAPDGTGCLSRHLLPIAGFIAECLAHGKEVILVSSGAVAAGRGILKREVSPIKKSIPEKQALAAIGQAQLMAVWSRFFDVPCAQVLLTHDDLKSRRRFVNAKNTLAELLHMGALPIVNENDTVATAELRVGDNENLAAYVAILAEADLLIILSDVAGLFDKNPRLHANAQRIPEVRGLTPEIMALAGGTSNGVGTGGMITKLQAAEKATARGINTVIANGTDSNVFKLMLQQQCPGTLFHRMTSPTRARKLWLQHALPVSGRLNVDSGAMRAISAGGASLLPSGIIGVEGSFQRGDAIEVWDSERLLAKGISQYDASSLIRLMGRKSHEISDVLGYTYGEEVIHRADMVVLEKKAELASELC